MYFVVNRSPVSEVIEGIQGWLHGEKKLRTEIEYLKKNYDRILKVTQGLAFVLPIKN